MSRTEIAALGATAVSAYEILRGRILELELRGAGELGLSVLLRKGMLAWICAHASVLSERRPTRSELEPTRVSMELHDELLQVMLAIAMASSIFDPAPRGVIAA